MAKQSAGVLLYRVRDQQIEVLLVHPGGPFWVKKDADSWSIPKGEMQEGEQSLEAARREFYEETGSRAEGSLLALGEIKQSGGKVVAAWALEGEFDCSTLVSETCEIEWPPRSGRLLHIPEVDRAEWFVLSAAKERLVQAQVPFLERLSKVLSRP